MKSERGMALIPLLLTIFVLLALVGATIFMIGDGFLFNKDVKSTVQNETNDTENKVEEKNNTTEEDKTEEKNEENKAEANA